MPKKKVRTIHYGVSDIQGSKGREEAISFTLIVPNGANMVRRESERTIYRIALIPKGNEQQNDIEETNKREVSQLWWSSTSTISRNYGQGIGRYRSPGQKPPPGNLSNLICLDGWHCIIKVTMESSKASINKTVYNCRKKRNGQKEKMGLYGLRQETSPAFWMSVLTGYQGPVAPERRYPYYGQTDILNGFTDTIKWIFYRILDHPI